MVKSLQTTKKPTNTNQKAHANQLISKRFFSLPVCCTLYQQFLHIVGVDVLCMPTMPTCPHDYSKDGQLLDTGQLSNNSPSHHHTHQIHVQTSKPWMLLYSSVHQTKCLVVQVSQLSWDLSSDRFPDIGQSTILQYNCALFCINNLMIVGKQL